MEGIEEIKMKPNKRARSENWLEEDKIIPKELVKERVSVLENKNTDTNTNSRKVSAWIDLKDSFNCMCKGTQRTVGQLKSQWGQIKMTIKKHNALERKSIFKTGGGPQPALTPDSWNDIGVWLPNEFTVDTNEFDSDQIPHVQSVQSNIEIIKNKDEPSPYCLSKEVELVQEIELPESSVQNAATPENKQKKDEVEPIEIQDDEVEPIVIQDYRKTSTKNALRSAKKIKKKEKKTSPAERIAEFEIKCRKELHRVQMENEEIKKKYLEQRLHNSETRFL